MLAGSQDGTVWMWLALTGACMQVFAGHEAGVTCGGFTSDGATVVTGPAAGPPDGGGSAGWWRRGQKLGLWGSDADGYPAERPGPDPAALRVGPPRRQRLREIV